MKYTALLLLVFSISTFANNDIINMNLSNVEQSYSGYLSFNEVLSNILSQEEPGLKERTVTISIPMMKESKVVSKNIKDLPFDLSKEDVSKRTITIAIPFKLNDFLDKNKGVDVFDFAAHISESVQNHQILDKNNKDDALNQPNCGGYSMGTTITDKKNYGCLGTIETTYTCQSDPVSGGQSWYMTKNTYTASTECGLDPE